MGTKANTKNKAITISIILLAFIVLGSFALIRTELFQNTGNDRGGLSGLVSVRGTVSLEQLKLSKKEIAAINAAVNEHRDTFNGVGLYLDTKGDPDHITPSSEMTWALDLDTSSDIKVKSWSRKVNRGSLVSQMVAYMHKAAREYKEFQRYPDVKQNFKTLYI